jgi:anti-sigma B factor antagonist
LFFIKTIGGQVLAQYIGPFRCEVKQADGEVTVAPHGELDMATVGGVEQELARAKKGGAGRLVLDLRGLSFMDSSGLHLVSRWHADASQDGFVFEIVPGPPVIQRVFELAQMTHGLPFREAE